MEQVNNEAHQSRHNHHRLRSEIRSINLFQASSPFIFRSFLWRFYRSSVNSTLHEAEIEIADFIKKRKIVQELLQDIKCRSH